MPEIEPLLLPRIEIVETGLLDNLSAEEIERLQPESGETPLVTRLRDSSQVQLSDRKIFPLMSEAVDSMKTQMNVQAVGVLCTHDFPTTDYSLPVIFPSDYISFIINHLLHIRNLGVIVPLESQVEMAGQKWRREKVTVVAKSPYAEGESWEEIAQHFAQEKVEALVLDCIGFKTKDRQELQRSISSPILLPRLILASAINQLL